MTAATENFRGGGRGSGRIRDGAAGIKGKGVLTPFTDVASGVIEAPGIRQLLPAGMRAAAGVPSFAV